MWWRVPGAISRRRSRATDWCATTGCRTRPTIGTLGCVITPDADDTALAWRIAGHGAGDPRAQRMLRTLARYRDARGLYRTWLAPQEQYQCLDPGRDPNPADIVIQMHVYLMLRELDPPAARNLCKALQRAAGDDDVWVYYAKAPLVPYLRSAELRQLGCRASASRRRGWRDPPRDRRSGASWCDGSWRHPRRRRTRTRGGRSTTCSRASAATTSPCFAARRRCSTTTI